MYTRIGWLLMDSDFCRFHRLEMVFWSTYFLILASCTIGFFALLKIGEPHYSQIVLIAVCIVVLISSIPVGCLAGFSMLRSRNRWQSRRWWLRIGIWKTFVAIYALVALYFLFLAPIQRFKYEPLGKAEEVRPHEKYQPFA
jgi:amino acid transporter